MILHSNSFWKVDNPGWKQDRSQFRAKIPDISFFFPIPGRLSSDFALFQSERPFRWSWKVAFSSRSILGNEGFFLSREREHFQIDKYNISMSIWPETYGIINLQVRPRKYMLFIACIYFLRREEAVKIVILCGWKSPAFFRRRERNFTVHIFNEYSYIQNNFFEI